MSVGSATPCIKTDNEQGHACVFPVQSPYFHSQNVSVIIRTGLRVGILWSRIPVKQACETTAEYSLQWKQLNCVTTDGGKNTGRAVKKPVRQV